MADASAFGKPVNKYKQALEAMQRGANTLAVPAQPEPAPAPAAPPEQGLIGQIDDSAAAVAAQNAANPSIQDKLQKIAAARAKFYGEGATPAAPAPATEEAPGQVYPAMQPKGRR